MIFAKTAKYRMGIIWIWYGYRMVRDSAGVVFWAILPLWGMEEGNSNKNANLEAGI